MKFEIKNRWNGEVIFSAETESFKLCVELAVKAKSNLSYANLRSADLRSADLRSADLSSADLSYANLSYANLRYANLSYADLRSADLSYANLSYANLRYANLSYANLRSADLRSADLSYANLRYANLSYANLSYADLSYADLRSADLSYANLRYAKNSELAIAQTRILPDGDIIGWKKCVNGVIVKLLIPSMAKRSSAFGRKCRAEYANVLEVIGTEVGISQNDKDFKYIVGETVNPDKYDEDWTNECSGGIHFFITRIEAENY